MPAVFARVLGFCTPLVEPVLALCYAKWVVHTGPGSQRRNGIGLMAAVFTVNVSHFVVS